MGNIFGHRKKKKKEIDLQETDAHIYELHVFSLHWFYLIESNM